MEFTPSLNDLVYVFIQLQLTNSIHDLVNLKGNHHRIVAVIN